MGIGLKEKTTMVVRACTYLVECTEANGFRRKSKYGTASPVVGYERRTYVQVRSRTVSGRAEMGEENARRRTRVFALETCRRLAADVARRLLRNGVPR